MTEVAAIAHLMSAAPQTKNEIIEALLGDDDEEFEVGLGKELSEMPHELLDRQIKHLLPSMIQRKERYLQKKCVKTSQGTNPKGETFLYGQFGSRNGTIATLLYLDPKRGWVPADGVGPLGDLTEDEDEFADEDFKEVFNIQDPKRQYLPIGSYSSGTMRMEDLIPRFIQALGMMDSALATKKKHEWHAITDEEELEYFCWEDLVPALEEHAPPYTYFGSHEGDGADYGVWISHEAIEEALETEELRPMRKGEPFVPGETDVVLLDDGGNYEALLNGQTGEKIWEI
jgi:hypothetical protein